MSGWISIGEPDVQSLTPLEMQVKRYLDKGYHPNVISCIIKQSREQTRDLIYEIRKKEGIMRKATVSDDEKQTMKRMYAEGKSINDIAEATGRGRSTVDRIVNDRKAAKINKEFDAAVDQMIETMHSEPEPVQLEDVENGIPNTPLMLHPAFSSSADLDTIEELHENSANAEEKFTNAEEKFTNAEEWRLPYNVQVAVDRYISDIDEEIAMRAQRIAELTQELEEWTAKRADLASFKKAYSDKVAAAVRAAS